MSFSKRSAECFNSAISEGARFLIAIALRYSSLNDLIERQYDYDNENIEEEEEIFKINNSNALNNYFDFNYNQQFDGMKLESSDEKPPKDYFEFLKKIFND